MSNTSKQTPILWLSILSCIILGVVTRLIPHPFNFTAIGAVALLGGAYIKDKRLAFVVPFAAMFLSDMFIGFHNTIVFVYGSFLITVALGFLMKENKKPGRVILLSILSSAIFFVLTNFGTWWLEGTNGAPLYPHTLAGLEACFINAVPFIKGEPVYMALVPGTTSYFANFIYSGLLYSGLLFGAVAIVNSLVAGKNAAANAVE